MVEKIRKDAGKSAEPHYALIDSQSVKTVADNEKRGIDGGKKAKGRKRHAVIDTMGNLLGIVVHAANIHDTKSGILAAQKACKKYPSIQAFCADAGYRGTCIDEVKVTPHNSLAALAMPFLPSASCRNLDLPPVNLRFLQSHLTKNAFAIAPTHLCGIA
nr:MAG TPA: putative transposase [Caudoviricetes sp.]